MKEMKLVDFAAQTASAEPVPGGGSIAAVSGALSAALTEMVANLTIGKKKYEEFEAEMKDISAEGAKGYRRRKRSKNFCYASWFKNCCISTF